MKGCGATWRPPFRGDGLDGQFGRDPDLQLTPAGIASEVGEEDARFMARGARKSGARF
jgi:hypothetical protein